MENRVINKFFISFILLLLPATYLHTKEMTLPEAVSNNAVAYAEVSGVPMLFSFNGLAKGKTYKDIHAKGFSINLQTGESKSLASLPDGKGRLASIAVSLNNRIFVIGGYTVAADHSEVSTPQIYEYIPLKNNYRLVTEMPTPVDDTVALVYQNRFIYLISGWHDTGNVNLVQVYDSKENRWFNATPFPGAPVFGHAGGIVANKLVIADGVKINEIVNGKRQYGPSDENWIGHIDGANPALINWTKIDKHPFKPLYRMAAVGLNTQKQVIFVGGSDNPYNYNGIGYDKRPSEASSSVFSYDLKQSKWIVYSDISQPSMDHRGLLVSQDSFYILGGMGDNQQVLSRVNKIPMTSLKPTKESK